MAKKRCPICGKSADQLYQRSYPGTAEYVSPRCLDCYDALKEVKMAKRKLQSVKQRVATSGHTEQYAPKKKGGKHGTKKDS